MANFISSSHYFLSQSQHINELISPLKRFGICHYTYMKKYNDGKQVYLSNNSQWIEDYYNLKLYDSSFFDLPLEEYQNSHVLWDSDQSSDVINHGRQYFNSDYGITIIINNSDNCEFHFFSSTIDNKKIMNFYVNNLDLLYSFIDFFKNKADIILQKANKNALIITSQTRQSVVKLAEFFPDFKTSRADFFNEINQLDHKLNFKNKNVVSTISKINFSKREQECLTYLIEGKSAKQTARMLNISPRTVEVYIESLKQKLDCKTKIALISKVMSNCIV